MNALDNLDADDTKPFVKILDEKDLRQAYPENRTLATLPKKKKSILARFVSWLSGEPAEVLVDQDADEELAMKLRREASEKEWQTPSIFVKHQREPHTVVNERGAHSAGEYEQLRADLAAQREQLKKNEDVIIQLGKQVALYEETVQQLTFERDVLQDIARNLAAKLADMMKAKQVKKRSPKKTPKKRPALGRL